jgi:uncharacterized protein DUF4169
MAEIVNLRMRRKQEKRRRDDEAAAANRLAHGIGKTERDIIERNRDKADRDLDRHRRDDSE